MEVLKEASAEFSAALLHLLDEFGEHLCPDYKTKTRGSKIDGKDDARKIPQEEEDLEDETDELANDVNIWDELQEAEGDNSIVYGMKKKRGAGAGPQITIRAATLNRLIVRLTDQSSHGNFSSFFSPLLSPPPFAFFSRLRFPKLNIQIIIDLDFVKTFITTFQSFTTPEVLFAKLLQRYLVLFKLPMQYLTLLSHTILGITFLMIPKATRQKRNGVVLLSLLSTFESSTC